MSEQSLELLEKIRQQFDFGPYPRIPIETSPASNCDQLFIHNAVTAFYMRDQRIVDPRQLTILDVGCGSGYKTLTLALANPGARIVGIDLSEKSIELAHQRLEFHNIKNVEWHVLNLEQLPELGLEFDYINCDELLYLFPDISHTLATMGKVLKPDGIIRANLHSAIQREPYFRAQELFQFMGLMESNPEDVEIQCAIDTFKSMKTGVELKEKCGISNAEFDAPDIKERMLMNFLLQGDKGYRIRDLFSGLRAANLEFISMVDWRQWEILDLFRQDTMPALLAIGLEEVDVEERLYMHELLHPVNRLLDFWCGHPTREGSISEGSQIPTGLWDEAQWKSAQVRLHPQLAVAAVKQDLIAAVQTKNPFQISNYITGAVITPLLLDPTMAACLLPLWDGPQPVASLVKRLQRLQPLNLVTAEPIAPEAAFQELCSMLKALETPLYVLLQSNRSA
jgi:SAM-dependent methyltransferase